MPDPRPQTVSLTPGLTWFQVLTPNAVLAPDGSKAYAIVGTYADLGTASVHAAQIMGCMIVLNVCLYENLSVAPIQKAQ